MVVSDKPDKKKSDYIHYLFKNSFKFNEKRIISSGKIRNSGNYNYDYFHSFFGKDFQSKPLYQPGELMNRRLIK